MITCHVCGSSHKVIYEETQQGHECACFASDSGVMGCYGSKKFDGDFFSWRKERIPSELYEGLKKNAEVVVCDECVEDWIDRRVIVKDSSGNFFGLQDEAEEDEECDPVFKSDCDIVKEK